MKLQTQRLPNAGKSTAWGEVLRNSQLAVLALMLAAVIDAGIMGVVYWVGIGVWSGHALNKRQICSFAIIPPLASLVC